MRRPAALATLAALVLLAACDRKREEPPVPDNSAVEMPLDEPAPAPPPPVENAATPEPPKPVARIEEPELTDDEQTALDADATGLTSRTVVDESAADEAAAPGEPVEKSKTDTWPTPASSIAKDGEP
jgi:hypothetical protein